MPVEPMKALAGLTIAGALTCTKATAAGIVLGVLLLIIAGSVGLMRWMSEFVPVSVIRGIQPGPGLILLRTSANYIAENIWISTVGIGIVLVIMFIKNNYSVPDLSVFVVMFLGIAYGL